MISNKVSPKVASESNTVQKQLKYMIFLEAVTGVNRLYLIFNSKFCITCVTTYNFVLFLIASFTYNLSGLFNTSQSIYKNAQLMEYLLLCICAVFLQKSSLENFFRSLSNVDALFNIEKDISIVTPRSELSIFLFVIFVCNILDFALSFKYFRHPAYNVYSYGVSYLTIAVNDFEMLFFCTLLGMVLKRLTIVHAHVAKEFSELNKFDKLITLTRRIKLDVTSLHKIYERLQYSSCVLESVMAFPLLVMFTACGIVTIMMLRGMTNIDTLDYLSEEGVRFLWLYATLRCIKNGISVLLPCYYATLTIRRARSIRYALKTGLSMMKSDVRRRRQLKAFYQLTRDNEFAYTLWGNIRLNMHLPLNYYYMCLTYFIIVVQFAKFFD